MYSNVLFIALAGLNGADIMMKPLEAVQTLKWKVAVNM